MLNRKGLSLLNKLFAHFEGMDPNIECFVRIERMAQNTFHQYHKMYDEKIQTKLMNKAIPATPSAPPADDNVDDPQSSTSDASSQ